MAGEGESVTDVAQSGQGLTFTLEVLSIIKESQLQHGLRHGDYQRYRSYCTRRLRRVRKSLKFSYGNRNKFVKRQIKEEIVKDVRFLYLPLVCAERSWAYAMQLKTEGNTEPRKRFHVMSRLRKAVKFAAELEALSQSDKCDARSKLEAKAYFGYMKGMVLFEEEKWENCIETLSEAKTIYEKLASALNEEQSAIYLQRVEEISPSIRYCAYNIGDESAINDLVKMRLKSGGQMSTNIDSLLAQTREKQAATLSEVTWRGRTVPVRNEQVRAFLLTCQENEQQVSSEITDSESKVSVYESLLMQCKDSLQIIREELKADPNAKAKGQRQDGPVSTTQYLHTYLTYIRLTRTIERNILLAETLKANLQTREDGGEQESANQKRTKPQDLIRLCDIILQNLSEIPQLPGLEGDVELQQEVEAKTLKFKAYRCFYLAQSYSQAKKWTEAAALFERAMSRAESSRKEWKAIKSISVKAELTELDELIQQINGVKYSAHAASILDSSEVNESMAKLNITASSSSDTSRPVSERLGDYRPASEVDPTKPNLVAFPPAFKPVPCKPLFFDIALNHLEFPSLEDKLETNKAANAKGGIGGFLSGWWGGGKK
ncbi:signal recognition particle subunit SRP68 [Strongylocentrotus purpuratus]|uniref:Signal recognition particle subunit SRP68 n=1 Tax=Strongylocentrotus purpuratus TaxID=7668 RepID=A0A7M7GKA6_STRPU|nr:signal recognition particle subunit SRP68 [Strongylocentrotus purpuratus]